MYIEHLIDDDTGRWKYIDYDNVITFNKNNKKQFFRIYNVIKSINKVVAYAQPLFFTDCINNVILNQGAQTLNGQEAITLALQGTDYIPHSDISTTNIVDWNNLNVVEALLGDNERSFINVFGGEFLIDGWDIYINSRIGSETGVEINFGYNLSEIEYSIDTSETITRIIPISKEGIKLNDTNTPWVDSANLSKYPTPKARLMQFDDIFIKANQSDTEGYNNQDEVRQALQQRCEQLFSEGTDQPKTNFKVDMVNISNVTLYKDVQALVTVNGGDTLIVNCPHLGVTNLKVRVIDYEWDVLGDNYLSIELGSAMPNFLHDQIDIQQRVNNITNDNGTVKADVLSGVMDAHQTMFKATKDVAQPQDVLGMIFEDRVPNSPTFGSLMFSSQGMAMANEYIPGTENFDYRTFITGSGIVADSVTTGTMSANRVRAGLLESVNKQTWINMDDGTFSFANGKIIFDGNNVTYDFSGTDVATKTDVNNAKTEVREDYQNAVVTVNGQGVNIKNGALTVTDNQNRVVLKGDAQGDLTFTGKLQPNDYQLRLFGNDCKIDGSANAIRLQLNPNTYLAVDADGVRIYNQHSQGGNRYTSITYGSDGHTDIYNSGSRLRLLGGSTPEIQGLHIGTNTYIPFAGSQFRNVSSREYKTDIKEPNVDFIKVLKENKIRTYQYKNDIESGNKLGFILDELTEEAKEYLNPNGTDGIDVYSMVSMLWGIVQEQQKQIEELKGGI